MTIGISKEDLPAFLGSIKSVYKSGNEYTEGYDIDKIINQFCKELNPWIPIDENTPNDKTLLGFVNGKTRLIRWGKTSHVPFYGFCLADQGAEDFDICKPTHWQELPNDPKE